MEKKAIIFMDYNNTFDDIKNGKGYVLFYSLRKFISHFKGEVDIVVISASPCSPYEQDIKSDLKLTLTYFPSTVREKFKYLIEKNCRYISAINFNGDVAVYSNTKQLSELDGSKKVGVETFLTNYDKSGKFSTCVFVGDSKDLDLVMLDADVGDREKYMILANSGKLKEDFAPNCPKYKLSFPLNSSLGKDILEKVGLTKCLLIKSSKQSYGVGKGFEATVSFLEEKENLENKKNLVEKEELDGEGRNI